MKTGLLILTCLILLSAFMAVSQTSIPVDDTNLWTESAQNPLFGGTSSGIDRAYYPVVIRVGSVYHLWYGDGSNTRHATSSNPSFADVTFPAQVVTGITAGAYHPRVLYNASGWTVGGNYYAGPFLMYSTTGSDWNASPRIAHSVDGVSWIDIGACTGVNAYSPNQTIYNFDVVYENVTTWKAYADNGLGDVEYWTSTDGLNWTGVAHDILRSVMQPWESDYTSPHVFKIQNTYIMFYGSGGTGSNQGIGLATSSDGQTFTKSDANPIFSTSGTPPEWRTNRTYTPYVFQDNFDWKMYFTGQNATGIYSIGYATNGGFYWTLQSAIDASTDGDTINVAEGTYEGFTISGKSNLTIKGAGNSTLIRPSSLITTGVGHKYDANMSVSVFVNNSANVVLQDMKIEDNGVTPCGAGTPNAIVFWNASTGTINNCTIHGTYSLGGCQTGQGIAVDAGLGQTTTLGIINTNIAGFQKNAIDVVDGNSLTGNPGTITVNITGGTISGAGPTSTIAQNGILYWNRSGGNVGGTVDGLSISNLEFMLAGTTASGIISSGDAVTISNASFSGVQRYLASMGTGVVTATNNNIFDGINPSTASLAQLALLEDKIDHQMDDNATGLIMLKSGYFVATPNNLGIQQAVNLASSGNTVVIGPGTFTPTSTITVNKPNLTLQGVGTSATILKTSQPVGNLFTITGSGVTLQDIQIEKTDKAGMQNIIFVNANNVTIINNLIWGKYIMGDPDVSRAMVVAGGLTGLMIEGNTIYALRQPTYFSNSAGSVVNNFVYGTRGWVIEDGNFNFTGNTWGSGATANYVDIAILATVNPSYYTDIVAMSNANNQAVIEDQRLTPRILSIVYVDSAASAGGDGTATNPYQTITPALTRVATGGTILVAKGTYNEDVIIGRGMTVFSLNGRDQTIVNGQLTGWSGGALRINASNVTVGGPGKGFTFNSKTGGTSVLLAAFYISAARNNLLIEENRFVAAPRDPGNNESYALLTEGGQTNHTYLNNIFDGMSTPRFLIYVNGWADVKVASTNIDFIGNTFVSTAGGLSLSSSGGEISGNYFQGMAGLGLSQYSTNTITGNFFQGVGNQVSLNDTSGVTIDDVLNNNSFVKKVVVKNTSGYRYESYPWGYYATVRGNIQGAVDAASVGDSVLVSNETYEEQVEISKDIILHGESMAGTTIKAPVNLTKYYTTSVNNYPVVYVHDAAAPEISNFTIDGAGRGNGNYRFQGIGFRNAGGKVDGCTIKDIRETPINGNQHGVGIYAYDDNGTARTLYVNNNTIYGFQKNGTAFNGPDLTAFADNNTITGAGAVSFIAQNCLQIGFGATGSLTNNIVGDVSYTPNTDVSCGLLLFQSGGTIQTLNNTISNTQVGIDYINVGGEIKHNNITASAAGVGTTTFWGIIADPGESQRVKVQPFDMVTSQTEKPTRILSSVTALATIVDSNTVTGDGMNGVGIEADALGTETLNFSANENTVSNWGTGFILYKEAGATLNGTLRRNSITGNKYGVLDQTGALQDAKENWWGSSSGPADPKTLPNTPNYNNITGTGDSVSSFIDYNPWYVDAGKTTLSIYMLTINVVNGSVDKVPDQLSYNHGTSVQLTPIPHEGYHFTGWTGDVPAGHELDNVLTVVMDQNRTITAGFTINTYTLTVNAIHGTVDINPPTGPYNYGAPVTLTPNASPGYHFSGWSGNVPVSHESDNPLVITMDQNRIIDANFAVNTYSLIVNATNGTVDIDPPTGPYQHGVSVTLTPHPNTGYSFIGWAGDVPAGHETDNPLTIIMDANKTVTANFGINQVQVTVQTNPTGQSFDVDGITYTAPQAFVWNHSSTHTIATTSPQSGGTGARMTFANWSDGGAQSHTISPVASMTITANFTTAYLLTMVSNPHGGVSASPSSGDGYYASGSPVLITAMPDIGYQFSSWIGTGSGSYTGTNNPVSISMNGPIIQTASFSINTYTLTVNAAHGSVGKNPDQPSYNHGTSVQLTPNADLGYHFGSWSGDIPTGDESDNPLTVTMIQNRTITAAFIPNPAPTTYTIIATAGPHGAISPSGTLTFDEGESPTFTITPALHYHIDSVFVDSVFTGVSPTYTFSNIDTNHTIHAVFAIDEFTLTVTIAGTGTVTKVPDQPVYEYGTSVQLTATVADRSWNFSQWSGDLVSGTNPVAFTMDQDKNITATFNCDSSYVTGYRSFTAESLAQDKDIKGKINKYVTRKPDKVEFQCVVWNNAGQVLHRMRIQFSPSLIWGDARYPFTVEPTPSEIVRPNKRLIELVFNDGIAIGDSIRIHGWGDKGKAMVASYLWLDYAQGTQLKPVLAMNQIRYPMPNRLNALHESFKLSGFRDDAGLLVGQKRNDARKQYGWLLAPSYTSAATTLYSRRFGIHTGDPRGFDVLTSNGRPLLGRQRSIPPTKQNNKLLADLVALKLNIVASRLGITPPGFGELIYDNNASNILNNMTIMEIANYGDSLMMGYYEGVTHKFADPSAFKNLDSTVRAINVAFEGPIDTISFATSLQFRGVRPLVGVPYLWANSAATPARITPIESGDPEIPSAYLLYQNYPNPFNPTTTISFDLPRQSIVTLTVYNVLGQEIETILDREMVDEGVQEVEYNAGHIPSGVYFYRIIAEGTEDQNGDRQRNNFISVRKMILLK
jgi:hypothetical protein